MKILLQVFVLTLVDFILIWLWVRQMDPDPSISIGLLLLVPAVFVINIIIAIILAFIKKQYSGLFLFNSIISAILMYLLFVQGIDRHQKKRLESWNYKIVDTTYEIIHWKLENTFSISQSTKPGSSWSYLDGNFSVKGKDFYLTTDSTQFVIRNNVLYDFRKKGDSMKLAKVER